MSALGGFTLSTVMLAITGVAFVPAVIHAAGASTWGDVAFGQSAGILGAVVVGYGWMVVGPNAIARLERGPAVDEYKIALLARLLLTIPVVAVGAVLIWLLRPEHAEVGILAYLASSLTGLSASWWFIGRRDPYGFLRTEISARFLGTTASIALLVAHAGIVPALTMQTVGMLLGVALANRKVTGTITCGAPADAVSAVRGALRRQRHGLWTGLGQAMYLSLPVLLVGTFFGSALPLYALVDKLIKQVMSGVAPIVSIGQGWVPRAASDGELHRRVRYSVRLGLLGSVTFGGCFVIAGPIAVRIFSAGTEKMSWTQVALCGVLFGSVLFERITGRVALASLGRDAMLARSTLAGAVVGLASIIPLTAVWGATGAICAVLTGLVLMSCGQLLSGARAMRLLSPTGKAVQTAALG